MFDTVKAISPLLPDNWRKGANNARWKTAVLKRYRYTCPVTNQQTGLHVHHLDDASTNPHKRYLVSNGVPIAAQVHRDYHINYMGGYDKPCTRASFQQYTKKILRTRRLLNGEKLIILPKPKHNKRLSKRKKAKKNTRQTKSLIIQILTYDIPLPGVLSIFIATYWIVEPWL